MCMLIYVLIFNQADIKLKKPLTTLSIKWDQGSFSVQGLINGP